jgi:hypothetical protein
VTPDSIHKGLEAVDVSDCLSGDIKELELGFKKGSRDGILDFASFFCRKLYALFAGIANKRGEDIGGRSVPKIVGPS